MGRKLSHGAWRLVRMVKTNHPVIPVFQPPPRSRTMLSQEPTTLDRIHLVKLNRPLDPRAGANVA